MDNLGFVKQDDLDFCPSCGLKDTVWVEDRSGDYYVGPSYLCIECEAEFTFQGPYNDESQNAYAEEQRKERTEKVSKIKLRILQNKS